MREARAKTRAKTARTADTKTRGAAAVADAPPRRWIYWAAGAAALLAAFLVYGPALNGPFLFDDTILPYHLPDFPDGLGHWVTGVRPLLMFSYWLNYEVSRDPAGFHLTNVLIHALNSLLVFLIVRKLAGRGSDLPAGFAAAVFLLHPVQTEAVAYIAGRSECLSALFFLAAFAVFLYRRAQAASWAVAAAVLALFGAAVATKEHTLVLPGLLLLTDYFWNPGFSWSGARRNWRIYAPVAAGGLAGAVFVARVLARASSAGFRLKDFTWYQYFFTECRALFVYVRLLVFPAGLNVDWEFPISRNVLDHGAIFGLLSLLLLAGAAVYFRRREPLACYGFLVFLLLMAPTSSFVPIRDPFAERRLYLPMIGLLLVVVAGLRHLPVPRGKLAVGMACVLALLAASTYQRSQLWASEIALWEDTARKSPDMPRAHFQLAYAYYSLGRCQDAVREYGETSHLQKPDVSLLVDWGLAYDCAGQPDQAAGKLMQAAALEPTAHVYSQLGMVYAKQSRWAEALAALAQAQRLDGRYPMTYYYRGGVRAKTGDFAGAVADYQHALALKPDLEPARQGLVYAQQQLSLRR